MYHNQMQVQHYQQTKGYLCIFHSTTHVSNFCGINYLFFTNLNPLIVDKSDSLKWRKSTKLAMNM